MCFQTLCWITQVAILLLSYTLKEKSRLNKMTNVILFLRVIPLRELSSFSARDWFVRCENVFLVYKLDQVYYEINANIATLYNVINLYTAFCFKYCVKTWFRYAGIHDFRFMPIFRKIRMFCFTYLLLKLWT